MALPDIEILRLGNRWLVGKNTSRIVPVYSMQNIVASCWSPSSELGSLRVLARGDLGQLPPFAALNGFIPDDYSRQALQDTVFGVLASDRRVFRNAKGSPFGSFTPVVAGMAEYTPADDGIGRRIVGMLDKEFEGSWAEHLVQLTQPEDTGDPITALASALIGKDVEPATGRVATRERRCSGAAEEEAARAIMTLLEVGGASRLMVLHDIAIGAYLMALIAMLMGPLSRHDKNGPSYVRNVFLYGGLPPGRQSAPVVAAAVRSFRLVCRASWLNTVRNLQQRFATAKVGSRTARRMPNWEAQVRKVLSGMEYRGKQVGSQDVDKVVERLKKYAPARGKKMDVELWSNWVEVVFDLSDEEYARRVRALGSTVGIAGPDRGIGPRLCCETPTLGVLVKAVCGTKSMSFDEFIRALRVRYGIVVGLAEDDDSSAIIQKLGPIWAGSDAMELLEHNAVLMRDRLVAAGLARTYSDLHTEVLPHV